MWGRTLCSLSLMSDKEEEFSKEKLRQYQMNRLRYYYAVMECDSKGQSVPSWILCGLYYFVVCLLCLCCVFL